MNSSRTSSITAEKNQNGRFIAIFCILRGSFDLVGAITLSSIMTAGYRRVCFCLNVHVHVVFLYNVCYLYLYQKI